MKSVTNLLETFDQYKLISGLKVNRKKTSATYIGTQKLINQTSSIVWEKRPINTLGVLIDGNPVSHYNNNFKEKINKLKRTLEAWKKRKLTLKGKIHVINTLALSNLLYLCSIIKTPEIVFKEVKTLLLNFLWDGKVSKIKYETLIQPIHKGGLGLIDLEIKSKALQINWINRYINNNGSWQVIPNQWKQTLGNIEWIDFFKINLNLDYVKNCCSSFFRSICYTWFTHIGEPINEIDILNEYIWLNRFLKIDKKSFIWHKWKEKGINQIYHLINENGTWKKLDQITQLVNSPSNLFLLNQIQHCIPQKWKDKIKNNKQGVNVEKSWINWNDEQIEIKNINSKLIYTIFIDKKYTIPTSVKFWHNLFPKLVDIDVKQWETIFTLPFYILSEVRIMMVQYKLLNNIINCNVKLKNWNIITTDECTHCDKKDTIDHFFLLCGKTKLFWKSLIKWWNMNFTLKIESSRDDIKENILLGFMSNNVDHQGLNYVCLYAKSYIYFNKQYGKNNICFLNFLTTLSQALSREIRILERKGNKKEFKEVLESILSVILP